MPQFLLSLKWQISVNENNLLVARLYVFCEEHDSPVVEACNAIDCETWGAVGQSTVAMEATPSEGSRTATRCGWKKEQGLVKIHSKS